MASSMTYPSEAVDMIQPSDEQERRVLALAVKHGLLTPMKWDSPPTHFGSNRPTFAEICAFAADAADGVQASPAFHYSFVCYSCRKEWEDTKPESDCPDPACGTTNSYSCKDAAHGVALGGEAQQGDR